MKAVIFNLLLAMDVLKEVVGSAGSCLSFVWKSSFKCASTIGPGSLFKVWVLEFLRTDVYLNLLFWRSIIF